VKKAPREAFLISFGYHQAMVFKNDNLVKGVVQKLPRSNCHTMKQNSTKLIFEKKYKI